MLEYIQKPEKFIEKGTVRIASFITDNDKSIDPASVVAFGKEWSKFHNFSDNEVNKIGKDYFDLVDHSILNKRSIVLDVGCGSGRWCKFIANRVAYIEAIDPSTSVIPATLNLASYKNVRVTQASVESIPFKNNSFDFIYSLGVLHHVPDTTSGISSCFSKLKSGGWFLVYLYYSLENRSWFYQWIFRISNLIRKYVSKSSQRNKEIFSSFVAFTVYLPLSRLSLLLSKIPGFVNVSKSLPLSYYRDHTIFIMKNDALDRFGTPLEKRFSKIEIEKMLSNAGFINIKFSDQEPYWHAIAQKP